MRMLAGQGRPYLTECLTVYSKLDVERKSVMISSKENPDFDTPNTSLLFGSLL